MRRRLTLAVIGTVVGTLVLAGATTLLLARFGARQSTEHDLRGQAREIAASITDAEARTTVRVLNAVRRALDLEGVEVVRYGPAGRTVDALPKGVREGDLDLARLQTGEVLSGNHGALVYAAAPAARAGNVLPVVVLTREADPLLRPAVRWFALASVLTILLGVLVAWLLSRRWARPLRQAEEATRRIAGGDLSARVPDVAGDDELASLARSINAMAEGLERSRGVEQQFLLSVSHDLRTPLTSIRGYAEAIADGALPQPADGGVVILQEARRLERLVRDLLDLAKLESRQFRLQRQPVDLLDVAAGTTEGFRPDAAERGVTIDATGTAGTVVDGDPDRLAQVVANLVENALRHARSEVRVRVSAEAGWGRIDVADDGPGIAPADLPHVFERLYVSRHEPQRREAGSGLGLAIVRELVGAHGGRVAAGTAPGGGACLSVWVPLLGLSAPSSTS